MTRFGFRARSAIIAGSLAGRASRLLGKGSGGMIGGLVATRLDPHILSKVARGKDTVLITGTNGKSTTTAMVRAALGATGEPVASNLRGDNMTSGNLVALLDDLSAPYAALEVDELHLGAVADAVKPAAFILLNLSRDQLDRVGEITRVEKHIRDTINRHPNAWVVANCDDPLIVSAAWDAPRVIWVSVGCDWTSDATAFPRTGESIIHTETGWEIPGSIYARPQPQWSVDGDDLVHGAERWPLKLTIPGTVNRGNAAQAIVAAVALGRNVDDAVQAACSVKQVAGRYSTVNVEGRILHLLLAKNPAGWKESLAMLDQTAPTIILVVNGQVADGKDLSWLWDVEFETLTKATSTIYVTGERGADLAVRVLYAGVEAELVEDVKAAIMKAAVGPVEVLANYTAFRDLKAALKREGYDVQ
ncbi:MAG: MurT ligase domain-containing protein [Actinomycetaceae bacterium]|nr:MurT ligase domain-containing protein [Actinomycetaceae bacterium]